MSRRGLVGLIPCLWAAACGLPSGDEAGGERVHGVAVGAEVTLLLAQQGRCDGDQPLSVCVDDMPARAVEARSSADAFVVGGLAVEGGVARVTVRAIRPGDATLAVELVDWRGQPLRAEVKLRAAEISRTSVTARCDRSADAASAPLTIGAGASFAFTTEATDADGLILATGALELVTAPGFLLDAPSAQGARIATAPAAPGQHAWTLAGGGSLSIVVYDPAEAGVVMTSVGVREPEVTLRLGLGGALVCVHGRDETVTVEVASGGCRPVLGDVEVTGPMPLSIGKDAARFHLATGAPSTCLLTARLPSGVTSSAAFEAEPVADAPSSYGDQLGAVGTSWGGTLAPAGSCGDTLTDGDCDGVLDNYPFPPTDPDCYARSVWSIAYDDGSDETGAAIDGEPVGVGLTTRARLRIEARVLLVVPIPVGPPRNLRYASQPSASFEVTSLGCVDRPGAEVLRVVPRASGALRLSFEADNVGQTGTLLVDARPIAETRFHILDRDTRARTVEAARVDFFTGSEAHVEASYHDGSGAPLRGTAPLTATASAPGGGASVSGTGYLKTGQLPQTLSVASSASGAVLTMNVLDLSAVAAISDLPDAVVATGTRRCVPLFPRGADGTRIHGRAPARARLTLAGSGLVLETPSPIEPQQLCVRGVAVGETTLTLRWGAATAQASYAIVP